MKKLFTITSAFILLLAGSITLDAKKNAPQLIIFDTDMGNDVDDVMALDLLYKYMDAGKVKLLAVMSNKEGNGSERFLDILNTWYGYPHLPIGVVRNGAHRDDPSNYARTVTNKNERGEYHFKTTVKDVSKLPDAHELYRKILARQKDGSVVIISTGFSTNLARLLSTQGDQYSPLSGRELIARKVRYISIMAGCFDGRANNQYSEYNVNNDIPACAQLYRECPVPIVTSPFEVGEAITYPAESIENDFTWAKEHPMVEAYISYIKMPHNRPTWDLTSVLEVIEPGKYMTRSLPGTITVDSKGVTTFRPHADGLHTYLTVTQGQCQRIRDFFVKVLTTPTKKKH